MTNRLPLLVLLVAAVTATLFVRVSLARDPPLLADFKKRHVTTVAGGNSDCAVLMSRTLITECKPINTFIVNPGWVGNLCYQPQDNNRNNNNYVSRDRFTVVNCRGRQVPNRGCVYTTQRVLNRRVVVSCIYDMFNQQTYPNHVVATIA